MADFILFDEGADLLLADGLPATSYFGLSTKSVDATNAYTADMTLATSGLEITGTGYGRESESTPSPTDREVEWSQQVWETDAEDDWPSTVRSVFLASSADGSGELICAWNLRTGGAARDLSAPNTTQRFTPTLSA